MLLNRNSLMKKLLLLLLLIMSFGSCKSSKSIRKSRKVITETSKPKAKPLSKTEHIINYAKQFKGVRYKWGGTTTSGMDCSGLVYESFR